MASVEQMERFRQEVATGSKVPPRAPTKPRDKRRRKRSIAALSPKQEARQAFLAGVRAERIAASLRAHGEVSCDRCPTKYTTFKAAWRWFRLHHDVKRSKGEGYRGGMQFGVDEPENLELVCGPCHRKLESSPMFSGAAS